MTPITLRVKKQEPNSITNHVNICNQISESRSASHQNEIPITLLELHKICSQNFLS